MPTSSDTRDVHGACALFADRATLEQAIHALEIDGFDRATISVVGEEPGAAAPSKIGSELISIVSALAGGAIAAALGGAMASGVQAATVLDASAQSAEKPATTDEIGGIILAVATTERPAAEAARQIMEDAGGAHARLVR